MRVHWYNPENDLALAVGSHAYTPPRAAVRLQNAGSLLPLWYGAAGDTVLCYGVNAAWLRRMREDFGIEVDVFDHNVTCDTIPAPWGWSAYAKRFFQDQGFEASVLPTDTEIETLRNLSHRRTASEIASELRDSLPEIRLGAPAHEAFSLHETEQWLNATPNAYIKQPWSSSGRGVLNVSAISKAAVLKMADDFIRLQGSVMLEPAYDRAIDFAKIFECKDGRCLELGTSVFSVDKRGGYTGNLLAPEPKRLEKVGRFYDLGELQKVIDRLREILEQKIATHYTGILGVDMLIDKSGLLNPTVEINLRTTMGYVANRFTEQYLHPETAAGTFQVVRTKDFHPDLQDYETLDKKLAKGTLLLTPNNTDFTYAVTI